MAMISAIVTIKRHADTIRIRRKQLVYTNAYGREIYDKWEKEEKEFMENEVFPNLYKSGLSDKYRYIYDRALEYFNNISLQEVVKSPQNLSNPDIYTPNMDPYDYEKFCANLLRKDGWEAIATIASGDQGADVVATKNGTKVVLQCKLYNSAVGNEAVQQISAAQKHYSAQFSAVVSNAPYTVSAQQLAKTNDVFLLHHDELLSFSKK